MKKILIVADQKGWIFERHANEIKSRLSYIYNIDIAFCREDIKKKENMYHCIYVMDPMPISYPNKDKTIMGLRCEWLYKNHPEGPIGLYKKGFPSYGVSIEDRCSILHVVNQSQMKVFKDIVMDKPLLLVQHGVNTDLFKTKIENKSKFTIGISGRARSNGKKGFEEIKAICLKNNWEYRTAEYTRPLTLQQMPEFYNAIDVYVCFSETEGLNNSSLEAGACGCAIVSTRCGAAEEIINKDNGILINRNKEELENALKVMADPNLLIKYKQEYNKTITDKWSWNNKIQDFQKMFDLYFKLRS